MAESDGLDGAVGRETRAELVRLGALESVEGQIALRLAEQLDAPRNGMAVAGDARELRSVMATIRAAAPQKADSVDDSQRATDEKLRLVR